MRANTGRPARWPTTTAGTSAASALRVRRPSRPLTPAPPAPISGEADERRGQRVARLHRRRAAGEHVEHERRPGGVRRGGERAGGEAGRGRRPRRRVARARVRRRWPAGARPASRTRRRHADLQRGRVERSQRDDARPTAPGIAHASITATLRTSGCGAGPRSPASSRSRPARARSASRWPVRPGGGEQQRRGHEREPEAGGRLQGRAGEHGDAGRDLRAPTSPASYDLPT